VITHLLCIHLMDTHFLCSYSSASNDTKNDKTPKVQTSQKTTMLCSHTYFDAVAGACMAFNNIASVVAYVDIRRQ